MSLVVGILKFMTITNDNVCCSEQDNCLNCMYFAIYGDSQISCISEFDNDFFITLGLNDKVNFLYLT